MKYQKHAAEIKETVRALGLPVEEIAEKAGVKLKTFRNAMAGSQKLSDYKHQEVLRLVMDGRRGKMSRQDSSLTDSEEVYKSGSRKNKIPVVSWAQAGQAVSFDDLPTDWMRWIIFESGDPDAFAVEIVGDSMAPTFREGQFAILLPSSRPQNGDVVVARLKTGGAIMKTLHISGRKFKLSSINEEYPPTEYVEEDFHWIYPVSWVLEQLRRR